ncbi:hypothetical protein JKP88DRAFT_177840 [Tribonema minus]|uniref:6-pyruvoyltetrahydropterin synthase n=1 Tax=Tribonema minus TaxID=303371 RepID=A0A836CJP8_9STRA|nr:hypothetical protein JKP88DRAFT_177840 [Tribonema minus]
MLVAQASALYTLGIRDSIMIAHSFKGAEFGPAQQMHGATYTCDVEFCCPELTPSLNWVIDIGEASNMLSGVLAEYNFKNLNEVFPDENTTTEFMCRRIFDGVARACAGRFCGTIRVKLWESHKAWASYEGAVADYTRDV